MQARARDGLGVRVQQATAQQFADQIAKATGRMEVIYIRKPIGVDLGQKRYDLRNIGKILWF